MTLPTFLDTQVRTGKTIGLSDQLFETLEFWIVGAIVIVDETVAAGVWS
jgi:hypothetical protein